MTFKTLVVMKAIAALILGFGLFACSGADEPQATEVQAAKPAPVIAPPEWMYPDGKTHFNMRLEQISKLPKIKGGVMLLGDSITEGWMWHDFPYDGPIANHGIGWDTSAGVNARMEQILSNSPDVIFYMIGTNDLSYDHTPHQIARRIDDSLERLTRAFPSAKIYVQSVLPRDGEFDLDVGPLNSLVERMVASRDNYGGNVSYIDLTPAFSAAPEVLRPELTDDALHLNARGYALWAEQLAPYMPR